jgi:hypothetical protein
MTTVSVTRLHVRSWRFFIRFALYARACGRQAAATPGFLGGRLATEGLRGFWTLTVWENAAAMRAFRNADVHLRAMPKLLNWCDEASYLHWEQDAHDVPSLQEAHRRLLESGHLSKVLKPSAAHASGTKATHALPRLGPALKPS